MDWFEILWTTSFWVAAVRIATPLIFGTLGELVCERAGVLNLGIEGIMTLGAMTGWMSVYMGADLWTGVILAAMVGSLLGALHSMLTVSLGLSQHVTGIGISALARSGIGVTLGGGGVGWWNLTIRSEIDLKGLTWAGKNVKCLAIDVHFVTSPGLRGGLGRRRGGSSCCGRVGGRGGCSCSRDHGSCCSSV